MKAERVNWLPGSVFRIPADPIHEGLFQRIDAGIGRLPVRPASARYTTGGPVEHDTQRDEASGHGDKRRTQGPDLNRTLDDEVARHPCPGKGMRQIRLIDPPHQSTIGFGDWRRRVRDRREGKFQPLDWPDHRQGMGLVDHRVTRASPMWPSAPAKKSIASAC